MKFEIEYTDTFGGEANYSWVRRAEIEVPDNASRLLIMRRAKQALNLSGVRGVSYDHGEQLEFRPHGPCTVLFVTADYNSPAPSTLEAEFNLSADTGSDRI